jgi:hypothetical protein
MIDEDAIRRRFEALRDQLDERGQRLFAAAEVRAAGYGGLAAVARATGFARPQPDPSRANFHHDSGRYRFRPASMFEEGFSDPGHAFLIVQPLDFSIRPAESIR